MRHIKMFLFFIGVLFAMAFMAFFGIIGIIGVYGVFATLWEYCPNIVIGLGLILTGVMYVPIGWNIFCKFMDKLTDTKS
jgi:hypothetical protein